MAKQVFVSPINGEWKVKTVGAKRAAGIYEHKTDAIAKAREVAINHHAEMTVQKRNGQIGIKNSYGEDQFPPRG